MESVLQLLFTDPVIGPGGGRGMPRGRMPLSFLFTSGREMDRPLAAVLAALAARVE